MRIWGIRKGRHMWILTKDEVLVNLDQFAFCYRIKNQIVISRDMIETIILFKSDDEDELDDVDWLILEALSENKNYLDLTRR